MTIKEYRYLPHGKPIPKGWRLANTLQNTHHGHYAVLIMANHPRRSIVKNWPEYLREYRRNKKLTQKDLADKLQISLRTIENWEAGLCKPASYLKRALNDLECGEK